MKKDAPLVPSLPDSVCWDLVDSLPDGLCCADARGCIVYANSAFIRMMGRSGQSDLIGEAILPLVQAPFSSQVERFLENRGTGDGDIQVRMREQSRWVQLSWIQSDEDGRSIILVRDLSWYKAKEEELLNLALTDDLTGLYNRRGFRLMAEQELRHSRRLGDPVVLLSIDIDLFKQINDTFGHQEGDRTLKMVATSLKHNFRSSDVIGRWGGDEFLVLALDAPEGSVSSMEKRFRENLADAFRQRGLSLQVGVSIGHASGQEESLDRLIEVADRLMYEAKKKPSQQTP